ncbi:MAG: hypothetical protein MJ198_03835 [Bacteroidales bacterium]|nr:hypothetical protein [Bacteroidales bacterium]
MQHIKKKTNVETAQQPTIQNNRTVSTPQVQQTTNQTEVSKEVITQRISKPRTNFMSDMLSGKVTPPPTVQPQKPQIQPQQEAPKVTTQEAIPNTKPLISNKDKFEALSKENPLLLKLTKTFELNIS